MADVTINSLDSATNVQNADLFVLWQQASNTAKSISGQYFVNWLTNYASGHGGIQSIAKTGTAGLVDTYTITLADTTTTTFAVTNGSQGPRGDQTYVWVAYASQQPTSDADISTIPDDWMGIYVGLEDTFANLHYTDFDWYEIKGATGATGAYISSITWDSNSAGEPQYTAGTIDTYVVNLSDGTTGGTFSVYNGSNGTGQVQTVNGISPTDGNIDITAASLLSGLSYTTAGISFSNGSILGGGYCKIGQLVILNMRLSVTTTVNPSGTIMSGLPPVNMALSSSTNVVACVASADNIYPVIRVNGTMALTSGSNAFSGTQILSAMYITT